MMLLRVKDVSTLLNIKPSTLYLWAAQGKIPCRKIHGLIRFDPDAISHWLRSFDGRPLTPIPSLTRSSSRDLDEVIAVAKRAAYTARHGETISPSPEGKEQNDGAR
jgi:excisionase family DNA binding protein